MRRLTLEEAKQLVGRSGGNVFLFARMEDGSFRCAPIDEAKSHFDLFDGGEVGQVKTVGTMALLPDKAKIWQTGALVQPVALVPVEKTEFEQLLGREISFL